MRRTIVSLAFVLVGTLSAHAREIRDGANHLLGDDSFVAEHGRPPDARDSEALRMKTHLAHVYTRLAARPATHPDLADQRARLLGYLADYRDAGTTPVNTRLFWRSPVFIDDTGNICAVGYLIERSVGRDLAEQIAAAHRFSFLEEIAAAMPEVSAWIAASGFTLDELASIQPGYEGAELPWVEQWETWTADNRLKKSGRYDRDGITGRFRDRLMQGTWTKQEDGVVLGRGRFTDGAGTWRTYYPNGKLLATGPFANNRPNGTWKIYHPSGNLAGEGSMSGGQRHGAWTFYYDSTKRAPIAKGRFVRGSYAKGAYTGEWRHYQPDGSLLATARPSKAGYWLAFAPVAGVRHELVASDTRLHAFAANGARLYARDGSMFDEAGRRLRREAAEWLAADCTWSPRMQRAFRTGDLRRVARTLGDWEQEPQCTVEESVTRERAKQLDALLAASTAVHMPTPASVKALLAVGPTVDSDTDAPADLGELLATGWGGEIRWPHINLLFMDVYATLPGYTHPMLCPSSECRFRSR